MKIKLIKYHPKFAYSVGDVFEVPPIKEAILLDGGYAVPVEEVKISGDEEIETATDKVAEKSLHEARKHKHKNKKFR